MKKNKINRSCEIVKIDQIFNNILCSFCNHQKHIVNFNLLFKGDIETLEYKAWSLHGGKLAQILNGNMWKPNSEPFILEPYMYFLVKSLLLKDTRR